MILVEDNYTLWEGYLPRLPLTPEQKEEAINRMLTRWSGNADMYASSLKQRGFDAVRCVPSIRASEPSLTTHDLGHQVLRIPVGGSSSSGAMQALKFNLRLGKVCGGHPRIVHFNTYYSSYFAASLVWRGRTAVLSQYSGGSPPVKGPIVEKLRWLVPVGLALHSSNGVLLGDFSLEEQAQRKILTDHYHLNESQIRDFPPIVVNPALFYDRDKASARAELGFDESSTHILIVSAIPRRLDTNQLSKNPFAVLEAFSKVPAGGRRWHLHFVGFGPGFGDLVALAKELRIEDRATFHGIIEHEKLPPYYSASDLIINPYSSLDLRVGTATMEGFACARPVVMFKRSQSSASDQPGGFLVDDDRGRASTELESILEDPARLERKGREGPDIARRYALPKVVDRLIEIYSEVL